MARKMSNITFRIFFYRFDGNLFFQGFATMFVQMELCSRTLNDYFAERNRGIIPHWFCGTVWDIGYYTTTRKNDFYGLIHMCTWKITGHSSVCQSACVFLSSIEPKI